MITQNEYYVSIKAEFRNICRIQLINISSTIVILYLICSEEAVELAHLVALSIRK